MSSSSSVQRGVGKGAWLIVALLGWLALAPEATAHCGSRATPTASASRPAIVPEVATLGADPSPFAPDPAPACDGPSCSRRESPSPAGRGFEPIPDRGDGLAHAAAPLPPAFEGRGARSADDSPDDPRAASGVFHPPRARS